MARQKLVDHATCFRAFFDQKAVPPSWYDRQLRTQNTSGQQVGVGCGADRSSLVVPRLVDDSDSYHPLIIVLAHSMFVLGLLCFTLIVSVVFEFATTLFMGLLPKNSTLPEDSYGKINTQCKRVGESPAGQLGVPQCNEQHPLYGPTRQ